MSYQDVIARVEINTEKNQMIREMYTDNKDNVIAGSFEGAGYISDLMNDVSGKHTAVILFKQKAEDEKGTLYHTNKERAYFEELMGKKVFLAGLVDEEEGSRKLYVSTCYSLEDRGNALNDCEAVTEEDKRTFQKKIQQFSPEIQSDLADKYVILSGRERKHDAEKESAIYIEAEEYDVLFDVLKDMIPLEFRTEYKKCRRMMAKYLSKSEKQNCIKVISNILSIDWLNQYYKEIDVEQAMRILKTLHVGHEKQLEDLRTQFLTCNLTKKAPKTISLIGRSCGCGSLAEAIAEAIGREYVEIDLSGRNSKETDYLSGTSRIYENARCGYLFEKIMQVGTHGLLVIKNIDTYDSETLEYITGLIKKETYTDVFMDIPTDLSNLWIICTASSTKRLPMSLRKATHEILFEKISEEGLIRVINEVMLPKKCQMYHIAYNNPLPEDVCKMLIYQLSHAQNKKIEMNIEALVVKCLAQGMTELPVITREDMKKYYHFSDLEGISNEYATDLAALENKYFCNYDRYPDSIRKKVSELLEDIRYGDDQDMIAYCICALRYLVNPTLGSQAEYQPELVEKALKQSRYGQDYLVTQVCDALLAEKLSGSDKQMTVIGLLGPAGVGKTTAAEAIAGALDRNYIKINFGGAHDSSIIKGNNKAIKNAGPSLLISELARKNGTYSDVVNIDEFDKGNQKSYEAFHEFLDPANDWYYDEFLECNIPKNNFILILTFNDIINIPTPILDRMRIIFLDGYTMKEKKEIVKQSVLKKYEERMHLQNASITEDALNLLLREYSISPGIRDVEKDVEKLLIRMIKKNNTQKNLQITQKTVRDVLGSKRTLGMNDKGNKEAIPGQAMALGVRGSVGNCIAIQCVEDPYQRQSVEVSGLMMGSCLESLSDAMSYARRTLKQELPNLHISFRDPSVEKDGASAGLAMYMAIMSCLLQKDLGDCAFTGTIDNFGNVGCVGVTEKLSAAERECVGRVYIPQDNYDQLQEDNLLDRYQIEIIPVSHVRELNREFFGMEAS